MSEMPAASRPSSPTGSAEGSPGSLENSHASACSHSPDHVTPSCLKRMTTRLFKQSKQSHEDFASVSINKLILRMSIPNIISFGVTSLYAVVDSMFIGNAVGSDALAAFTVFTPIEKVFCFGFAMMLSVGSAPLIARALGQGDMEMASRVVSQFILAGMCISVALPLCLYWFLEDILVFLGATDATLGPALAYGRIICVGGLITSMFSFGLTPLLRVENKSRLSMWRMIISALINTVMDPILMYGTSLGLTGAAISTIVAQGLTGLWGLLYIALPNTSVTVRPKLRYFAPSRQNMRIIAEITAMGFGNFLSIIAQQVALVLGNRYIRDLAEESQVEPMIAALGVGLNIKYMIQMPLVGVKESYVPIAGFNIGARLMKRFRSAVKWIHVWIISVSVALAAVMEALAGPLADLYTNDADTVAWCRKTIRIVSLAVTGYGVGTLTIGTLQLFHKVLGALAFSILICVFYVAFTVLFSETDNHIELLFWAYPISDFLFGVIGVIVGVVIMARSRRRNLEGAVEAPAAVAPAEVAGESESAP